jgi:hypothetical protein
MKIDYVSIFKRALNLTWKNKYLWWFGFFVSVFNAGGFNFFLDDSKRNSGKEEKVMAYFLQNWQWIIWILAGFLILWVAFLILGVISRGALISSIYKNSKGEGLNFKSSWMEGRKYFWKILLIAVSLGLTMCILGLAIVIPVALLFINRRMVAGFFMAVLAVLIIIPLIILFNYLGIYGKIYVVLGNLDVRASLENAYALFSKNIVQSLIFGIIFIGLNLLVVFATLTALIPAIITFLLFGFLTALIFGKIGAIGAAIFGGFISIVLVFFIKSVYAVFVQSAWVFFFEEIARPKIFETIAEEKKESVEMPKVLPVAECKKE